MRELAAREKDAKQRLARINSEIDRYRSQSPFQQNYPTKISRPSRPHTAKYLDTPCSSSVTFPYISHTDYRFNHRQKLFPSTYDAKTEIPPNPPPRVKSLLTSKYAFLIVVSMQPHIPKSSSLQRYLTRFMPTTPRPHPSKRFGSPTNQSRYYTIQQPLDTATLQNLRLPVSTYLSTSTLLKVPRAIKKKDDSERNSMKEALKTLCNYFDRLVTLES